MVQLRNSLEALVVQAWRDRWSEAEWSGHLKEALAQDASDIGKLPNLLIKQATISEVPNKLILNYLSWSLTDHVVPHVCVLEAIVAYTDFGRELCIEALLELLVLIKDDLRCDSNDGFVCERLCAVCSRTLQWLLTATQHTTLTRNSNTTNQLVSCAASMAFNPFVALCVYFDHLAEPERLAGLCAHATQLAPTIADAGWLQDNLKSVYTSFVHKLNSLSQSLQNNPIGVLERELSAGASHSTVLTFVSVYGSCRLSSAQSLVAQSLVCLRCALGLPWWLVLKDLFRGAMLLLLDNITSVRESSVTAFMYLKVPRVITCLLETEQITKDDIQRAVDQIACLHILLNSLDIKTKCNSFQNFLDQMKAFNLISEEAMPGLTALRNRDRVSFPESSPGTQDVIRLIVKASGTVQTLEKSFNYSVFAKSIDRLVQMMSHMITGKSFDYICASSAAMGKLDSFTKKFIQFNETAQETSAAADESEHAVRAVMFDLSFLLLSRITSVYTDLQLSSESESFFVRWHERYGSHVRRDTQPTSDKVVKSDPDVLDEMSSSSTTTTDQLSSALPLSPEACLDQLKLGERMCDVSTCNWADVCKSVPALGRLLLGHINHNTLTSQQLNKVLIGLQLDVCALLLCLVDWLYHEPASDARTQLANAINQHFQAGPQPTTTERRHSHVDRWNFAMATVRVLLESMTAHKPPSIAAPSYIWLIQAGKKQLPRLNALQLPTDEHLRQVFVYAVRQSWATPAVLSHFERCMRAGHTERWCSVWVHEMLHTQATDQMCLASELCLAMAFLCDSPVHALLLLAQQVADFVLAPSHELYCVAPRGSVLAKLLVQALMLALQLHAAQQQQQQQQQDTAAAAVPPQPKQRRLSDSSGGQDVKAESNSSTATEPKQLLLWFYNRLCGVCEDGQLRPAVYLAASFVRILAENNTEPARTMIGLLPTHILPRLIRTDPKVIPAPVVLALYDLKEQKQRRKALQNLCLLRQLKAI